MIPGLGYFYNGLTSSKAALSVLLLCFLTFSVVEIQWFTFGYSLVFSKDGNSFIGTFTNGGFSGMTSQDVSNEPIDFAFALYQGMFAGLTPALVVGAGSDKARLLPKIIFILLWTTFVYDFIAYWCWNPNGFLKANGVLDFAGGSPVHIASGSSALAYMLILGNKGKNNEKTVAHSPANVLLGTILLWFGWNGFNGGSAFHANARASHAIVATNLSAAAGSLTWLFFNYSKTKRFSALSFCCGAIAGLVCITPAAGYVSPGYAVLIGLFGSSFCYSGSLLKDKFGLDDTVLDFYVVGCIYCSWYWWRYW